MPLQRSKGTENRILPERTLQQYGYLEVAGVLLTRSVSQPRRSDEDPRLCVPRFRVVCLYHQMVPVSDIYLFSVYYLIMVQNGRSKIKGKATHGWNQDAISPNPMAWWVSARMASG